ncbi:glutathione S-transferase family protein [Acinetobacter calcoaceticus]|uniref:Glutathione S-transferase n=1 Tax=Acinetobacter calcoaceticus TaxID=471 RepID=A0ABD5AL18_ACICA|nr:glutathione S-transferase family protein [Acinetobacter calcoaceticus]MDP9803125.1 glutathione S-transferase [Acinetobacter calcoaceticus]
MNNSSLTLISHHLCPFVQRAAIALLENNITFQRININRQDKPNWLLSISPTGKVPLLKVLDSFQKENFLFESVAFCKYIEETYTLKDTEYLH